MYFTHTVKLKILSTVDLLSDKVRRSARGVHIRGVRDYVTKCVSSVVIYTDLKLTLTRTEYN